MILILTKGIHKFPSSPELGDSFAGLSDDLPACSASRCTFGDTASIFKVSLIPKSPGEVIDGRGGWLVAQSGADSCRTDRFDFTSGYLAHTLTVSTTNDKE